MSGNHMKATRNIIYSIYAPGCKPLTDNYSEIRNRQQSYAKKVDADYEVFEFEETDFAELQFQKLFLLNDLSYEYDNLVYIDFDVLPTLKADNIFEKNYSLALHPLIRTGAVCNKARHKNNAHRHFNTLHRSDDVIFNTGVISAKSDSIQELDIRNNYQAYKWENNEAFLTWIIEAYQIDYQILPLNWNYLLDKKGATTVGAQFIHYSNKEFNLLV